MVRTSYSVFFSFYYWMVKSSTLRWTELRKCDTRVYPKVSGLAVWSENCKWYSSLPLGAIASLFGESV
jgi:hypothetical protein